jgi:hypothetical protein
MGLLLQRALIGLRCLNDVSRDCVPGYRSAAFQAWRAARRIRELTRSSARGVPQQAVATKPPTLPEVALLLNSRPGGLRGGRRLRRGSLMNLHAIVEPTTVAHRFAGPATVIRIRRLRRIGKPLFMRRAESFARQRSQHQARMVPSPVPVAKALAKIAWQIVVPDRPRRCGRRSHDNRRQ